MFDVVGEAAAQQMPRTGIYVSGTEKDVAVHKAERMREARPVEKSNEGDKAKLNGSEEEKTHSRNRLEDGGKIAVEKYDESGRLVKRTPPGYLPLGEMA
jgi:hypothetical protein